MIDIRKRAAELQQEEKKNPKDWKERLANDIRTQDGWEEFLDVMAEHPNYSVYNNARITHYRIINDIHDTQELITYEGAKKLGGFVMKGAKGIFLATPTKDGKFKGVAHYPSSMCRKLPAERYRHRPLQADPDDVESMEMFMQASKDVDEAVNVNDLFRTPESKEISSWVIGKRYNLLTEADSVPPVPDVSDLKVLVEELSRTQKKLEEVCFVVDQSLKYQRHPEWKEADELKQAQGETRSERQDVEETYSEDYTPDYQFSEQQDQGLTEDSTQDKRRREDNSYQYKYQKNDETYKKFAEAAKVAKGLTTAAAIAGTNSVPVNKAPSADQVKQSVHEAHERASQQNAPNPVQTKNESLDMGLGY